MSDWAKDYADYTCVLHEIMHIRACQLLGVKVLDFNGSGRSGVRMEIIVEKSGRLRLFLIRLFPWFFDVFFYLRIPQKDLRCLMVKMWLRTRDFFAKGVVFELREY